MKLPEEFLQSLEGTPGFDRAAFEQVHDQAQPPTSIRINPAKWSSTNGQSAISNLQKVQEGLFADCSLPIADYSSVPWCATGFYLDKRPSFTFDPLFHAGCYYVQEASSMFLEQPFRQLLDLSQPLKALDLCAAPGGKTTHIQSLLSAESLLVSNEVIKPRSLVLTDNVVRWDCQNVFVTNSDPKAFGKLAGYFDVMVVDAPCSGSGLFRKDEEAVQEWSLNNVALCSQRQQRILADALPALKEGGLLVYSTCSYSREEDEAIADWLVQEMKMESLAVKLDRFSGIVETASPQTASNGYRFYPDKVNGEGFFLACFRKKDGGESGRIKPAKADLASAKEKAILAGWIEPAALEVFRFRDSFYALPQHFFADFLTLRPLLNIQYAGTQLGEIMKDKLVPNHALAQSSLLNKNVPVYDLSYDHAIKYLQRQEFVAQPERPGWQVVRYAEKNLGWINALKNRVNNYYPKEIRILKQHNNTAFKK